MKPLFLAAMLFMQAVPQQRIQPGVITGQVRMIDGSPAVGIRVAALLVTEAGVQSGGSMLSALAQTDDAGRYRLESVLPGRYHIIAGFVDFPTYYPGVKALADSRIVTVEPGSNLLSIDFALARPVGIRVSGRVTGLPAGLPPDLLRVVLGPWGNGTNIIDSPVQSDGSFEFLNVAPGQYLMRLLPGDSAPIGSIGFPLLAVDDKDIGGLEIVEPRILVGRVIVEGGRNLPVQAPAIAAGVPDPPALLRFQARRADTSANTNAAAASVRSDGMFVWLLTAGEYKVGVTMLPIGYYVKSMSYGTANLLQESLKVADASDTEIHVTLTTTRPDSISPGVTVSGRLTVWPAGTSGPRWISIQRSVALGTLGMTELRVAETLLRADGSFEIPDVPPGTYVIRPIPNSGPIFPQNIVVANRDVTGLAFTLTNPVNGPTSIQ